MPEIKGFDAPNLSLQPSEVGVEATAGAARRVGAFYNQTGQILGDAVRSAGDQAVAYEDHREISAGAAHGAQIIDGLNQDWNNTAKNADPNDPSVAAKWREEKLEPILQQFSEGFNTEKSQAWAEHFVDQYRQHAFQKTAADMSSLAADAVHVNTVTTINKLSSAVYNDPSSLGFAIDSLDHSVGGIVGSSPNLTPDVANRVKSEVSLKGKEQIVKSAVAGAIANGGDWEKIANNPKFAGLINGAELQQFAKAAKTQERADLLQQKQIEIANRQLADQKVHQGANDIMNNRVSIDPSTGRPSIDPKFFSDALDIARKNPDAPSAAETVRTMINWGEAKQNEKAAPAIDDAGTKTALNASLYDPKVSLSDARIKIMQAEVDHKLTPQTANMMRQLSTELESGPIKEPIYGKTMVDASKQIGIDEVGKEHFANFQLDFMSQYLAAKRAGTAPANALDVKDPKSMISQAMKPYMRDAMTRARDLALSRAGFGPNGNLGDITGIDVKEAPPKPSEPAGVPAVKDREIGKAYPTPMGLMRWTADGWHRI